MAEAVYGKDLILLFRILVTTAVPSATRLAFQTEHEVSETRDSDSLQTKDGVIVTPQALETEISCTSILAKNDEMVTALRDAQRKGQTVEIWEIDLSQPSSSNTGGPTDKYAATYYQGKVTEWTKNPTAEDALEISLTFAINGEGQDGEATVDANQLKAAQYAFKDTVAIP